MAGNSVSALPGRIQRVDAFNGAVNRPAEGPGTNILLMGTDGRDTISSQEKKKFHAGGVECGCTDSLMLIHVSQRRDHVSVVSLPRDSLAQIPAHRDPGTGEQFPAHPAKINAAFAEGGPALSVRTVEAMTNVRVDHYLQIDFRRFMDSVNAVEGVDVCTPRRLSDSATKLDLRPGRHRLGGGKALQYVRSRHVDASADLGRIQRQHRFLVGVMHRLDTARILTDPGRGIDLARTVLGSTKVDQGFTPEELIGLASELSRLPAAQTEFTVVPIAGFNPVIEGVGTTLAWDEAAAEKTFATLNQDRTLTPRNSTVQPFGPPRIGAETAVRGNTLACS
ncbi:LCP family protein [Streptomyces sp. NPDC058695]|uniref:LCP family protein n=1 Tax=Streptomyces sp. NPDC058695 TaxID=3346604 RepID=UPI003661C818